MIVNETATTDTGSLLSSNQFQKFLACIPVHRYSKKPIYIELSWAGMMFERHS
jgi:hypothetical protein